MKRKYYIVLMVSFILVILFSSLVVAIQNKNTEKAKVLMKLNLIKANSNGFGLDKKLTRAEGAVIVIKIYGLEKDALNSKLKSPYSDVKNNYWAEKYITYAYNKGIMKGITVRRFSPEQQMSGKDFIILILRGLGYKDKSLKKLETISVQSGLLTNNEAKELIAKKVFLKDDMVLVVYNALKTKIKDSNKTLTQKLIENKVINKEIAITVGLFSEPQIALPRNGMDKIEEAIKKKLNQ